jgi:GNAT superfamily N-acetyltransferase
MPFYTQEEIPTPGGMEEFGRQWDPSLSYIFGQSAIEGFKDITPMLAKSLTELKYAGGAVYSEEEWKSSEFFREGLKYDPGMTEGQARLLAERFDQIRRHEDLMSRTSFGGAVVGVGGYLVGSIPDPINFIPWLGMVKKGKQIHTLLKATTRGKRAFRGFAEGAVGATAFQPLYAMERGAYQEEYDLSMALMDITLSAGIGGVFGGVFGKIHPKDPEFPTNAPVDAAPLSHVPLEDRLNAARVAHAEFKATGKVTGAAKVLNDAEVEPVTLEPGTPKAQADEILAGAPSGVIKGSFVESQLLNPDGSLMRVYYGQVQPSPHIHGDARALEFEDFKEEFIFAEGGETIGKVQVRDTETDFNVLSLEIYPEWRGQGLGMKWLGQKIDQAISKGKEPTLELAHNPMVIEWAKKRGGVFRNFNKEENRVGQIIFTKAGKAEQFETILPSDQTGGLISFTTDPEFSTGGTPIFLNVKNPHPLMDYDEASLKGAERFKKEGFDAVWSTGEGGEKVIFTVDPTQSKSIFDPEFRKLNDAVAKEDVTPVSDEALKTKKELDLEEEIADENLAAIGDRLSDEDVKDIVEVEDWSKRMDLNAQAHRLAIHCVGGTP